MCEVENLKNTERTLSRALDQEDLHLQLVLNGVNKTFTGHCEQGDFYLRLSPERLHSSCEIKREASILACIADHDASIAVQPFSDPKHAGTAFDWDGEPYLGIATTIAPGAPYDDSIGQLRCFGHVLAKLHAVPISEEIDTQAIELAEMPPSDVASDKLAEQISLVQTSIAEWSRYGQPTSSGKKSIRHGDAWPGNSRFSASEATLFDFEYTSIGDPVTDFAHIAWWLTGLQLPSKFKTELWSAFFEGYNDLCDGGDQISPAFHTMSF